MKHSSHRSSIAYEEDIRRPALPPLLVCSLGTWASCILCLGAAREHLKDVQGTSLMPLLGSACLLLEVVLGLLIGIPQLKKHKLYLCLVGIVLGLCLSCGYIQTWCTGLQNMELRLQADRTNTRQVEEPTQYDKDQTNSYTGRCLEDAKQGAFGSKVLAEIIYRGTELRVMVQLPKGAPSLLNHESFECSGELRALDDAQLVRGFSRNYTAYLKARNLRLSDKQGIFTPLLSIRHKLLGTLDSYPEHDQGTALLKAMLFGYRGDISQDSFLHAASVCGVAHLLAVSGAHLACVIGLLSLVLAHTRFKPRMRSSLCLVLILVYIFLTGAPISALRAALLASLALLSVIWKRRSASLHALGLCILIFLLLQAPAALSLSFQLSALSCLAICLLMPLFELWCSYVLGFIPKSVRSVLCLTLAANVGTYALTAPQFGHISLVSPLVNVLAAPLFSLVCNAGFILVPLVCLVPPLSPLLEPLVVIADLGRQGVVALGQHSWCAIPFKGNALICALVAYLALGGLYAWWPRPTGANSMIAVLGLSSMLVAACFYLNLPYPNELIMLDIGQGDALLLTSGRSAVLIDTGREDNKLVQGLARHRILHLDAICITHPDIDHCGSLDALEGVVAVDQVILSGPSEESTEEAVLRLKHDARNISHKEPRYAPAGSHMQVGDFTIEVLAPERFEAKGANPDSLCTLIRLDANHDGTDDWTAFLSGDAEAEILEELIDKGLLGHVDILKAPHHGSKGGLSHKILQTTRPHWVLLSCGEGNRYGHPHPDTLRLLEEFNIAYKRTDTDSETVCKFLPEGLLVESLR